MSALAREIGSRGRADAVVTALTGDEPEPCMDDRESAPLRSELAGMRLKALERRAVSEGLDTDAVEDAMDGDDPKSSLIGLIVELALSRGPGDRLLSALTAGGEATAEVLSAVLDHAMDMLDQVSSSSPRKSRKAVRSLLESVEGILEGLDAEWCDGVSRCDFERLKGLAAESSAVQGLKAADG